MIIIHDFTHYPRDAEKMFREDMRKHITDLMNSEARAYNLACQKPRK